MQTVLFAVAASFHASLSDNRRDRVLAVSDVGNSTVSKLSLGVYISVPFCRTKCSFCNFASGVSSSGAFEQYVEQVCTEIAASQAIAAALSGRFDRSVDSIYLGGGTPSVLAPNQLERLFQSIREHFEVEANSEITVECAPGTIAEPVLDALRRCGVNRVSLGVQSFVDQESSSVGRLHNRAITLDDIARLRNAGIGNIGIDLIAGLPHQTADSWDFTLSETLATGVPHVSVYMLEVDEDSRLGSELMAGGSRYHAHFVPDDDLTADFYLAACERLEDGQVHQYEISNFARPVTHGIGLRDSRHNLKYWTRRPYLGFGVDAHSMLEADDPLTGQGIEAVRFATPDSLEGYSSSASQLEPVAARTRQLVASRVLVDSQTAFEESFFLGLRLNQGVCLPDISRRFGAATIKHFDGVFDDLMEAALLELDGDQVRLTSRGRLLSNEVFARFLRDDPPVRT
jgi:putative oxygen-independent coproporphyrinogen III oxidase